VRRHKGPVLATALLVLALAVGVVGTAWGLVRARQALVAEEKQREQAEQAEERALKRLAQIEKGNEIITSIFAELDIRKVKAGTQRLEVVLARRLVAAAEQLEEEAVGDPLVVAVLQQRLGQALLNLGHWQEAISLFVKARETQTPLLGADHPHTLLSLNNLAVGHRDAGKLNLALPLFEEVLKLRKARLGADHPDTLATLNNLAVGYREAKELDRALPLLEESLKLHKARLGADHPQTLASLHNLAAGYWDARELDRALPLFEETLKLRKAKLGANHPDTLRSLNNLAVGTGPPGNWTGPCRSGRKLARPSNSGAFRMSRQARSSTT
jgi:eukaryotic-like serine/threonine-protein kinase